jgi:hypothetical protein
VSKGYGYTLDYYRKNGTKSDTKNVIHSESEAVCTDILSGITETVLLAGGTITTTTKTTTTKKVQGLSGVIHTWRTRTDVLEDISGVTRGELDVSEQYLATTLAGGNKTLSSGELAKLRWENSTPSTELLTVTETTITQEYVPARGEYKIRTVTTTTKPAMDVYTRTKTGSGWFTLVYDSNNEPVYDSECTGCVKFWEDSDPTMSTLGEVSSPEVYTYKRIFAGSVGATDKNDKITETVEEVIYSATPAVTAETYTELRTRAGALKDEYDTLIKNLTADFDDFEKSVTSDLNTRKESAQNWDSITVSDVGCNMQNRLYSADVSDVIGYTRLKINIAGLDKSSDK